MSDLIEISQADGLSFKGYFAPAGKPDAPGLVLVQEIFGINAAMREAAQNWNAHGFNVLVPDVFWRQEAGVTLEPRDPAEFARGVALMQAMDESQAVKDLSLACTWLASHCGHERVAALGYCLGGRLVVKMAAASPVRCAISYYGVGLDRLLPVLPRETAPVLLHIAENDSNVPEAARTLIVENAARRPGWRSWLYPGCEHAFARPGGQHWNADAAALAEQRSLAFMAAAMP